VPIGVVCERTALRWANGRFRKGGEILLGEPTKSCLSRWRTILSITLVALTLDGCVPNRAYRVREAAIEDPVILDSDPHLQDLSTLKLGFVEFDDMGEFWELCPHLDAGTECQLSRVLALIKREKQAACSPTELCQRNPIVVIFVHGWKNNASAYNEAHKNLHEFKNLLAQLAAREQRVALDERRLARTYVGIYMAWRGQVLAGDIFATFWNRRNAATRIAGPAFSEAVYRIVSASKENSPNTKVLVVGHSFGARLLENAISDTFISLILPNPNQNAASRIGNPVSPADLVVYVNSANDGFHAKEMIELLRRSSVDVSRSEGTPAGPLFLSVTSEGDLATKIAFPAGQEVSALAKSFRRYEESEDDHHSPSQRKYFTHTAGHIAHLKSHEVVKVVTRQGGDCKSGTNPDVLRLPVGSECYELRPKTVRWNDSPYWVTTVPSAIIPDHSHVFTEAFVEMLEEVIVHYDVVDSKQPTRMLVR
jgi:hypothetical protein